MCGIKYGEIEEEDINGSRGILIRRGEIVRKKSIIESSRKAMSLGGKKCTKWVLIRKREGERSSDLGSEFMQKGKIANYKYIIITLELYFSTRIQEKKRIIKLEKTS